MRETHRVTISSLASQWISTVHEVVSRSLAPKGELLYIEREASTNEINPLPQRNTVARELVSNTLSWKSNKVPLGETEVS